MTATLPPMPPSCDAGAGDVLAASWRDYVAQVCRPSRPPASGVDAARARAMRAGLIAEDLPNAAGGVFRVSTRVSALNIRHLDLADMDAARGFIGSLAITAAAGCGPATPVTKDRWFYRERMFTTLRAAGPSPATILTGLICVARNDWSRNYTCCRRCRGGHRRRLAWKSPSGLPIAAAMDVHSGNRQGPRFYEARGFCHHRNQPRRGNEKRPDASISGPRAQR